MPKSVFTKRYKLLREALTNARETAGLTQEQLAKRMGWNQTFVSKIERGVRRLDLVELIAICDVLNIDATTFVKRLQQNSRTPR